MISYYTPETYMLIFIFLYQGNEEAWAFPYIEYSHYNLSFCLEKKMHLKRVWEGKAHIGYLECDPWSQWND